MAKGWRKKDANKRRPGYGVWAQMIQRCRNPRHAAYHRYGGRGITVCERWLSFVAFLEDMGDPPPGLSLDRIDNEKGYCKENCRWATDVEQAGNRRNVRLLTFDGRTLPARRWAAELGVEYLTLYARVFKHGWTVERALTEPVDTTRRNRHAGCRRG